MDKEIVFTRSGVYLAKLDPAQGREVGKIRPVLILTAQFFLDLSPLTLFICPLSSQSHPNFSSLHVKLPPRDNLQVTSFALVEHCRSISINRILPTRLAQVTSLEIDLVLHRLQRLVGRS